MPTKDQLRSIEWAGRGEQGASCPACCGPRITGHHPRCWLALELATPDTLPPVEVGDVVAWRADGIDELLSMTVENAQDVQDASDIPEIIAIYRTPLWQRGKE